MKLSHPVRLFALLALALPIAEVHGQEGVEGRQATSRAQLIERVKSQKAVAIATPEEQRPRWELAEHSEFLSFNGEATLLPKRAIIHLPEKYRENVSATVKGKVTSWADFSAKYPNFITRVEVNLDQASGKTPVDPKVLEAAAKNGRIAVAVLNGNPISTFQPAPTPAP